MRVEESGKGRFEKVKSYIENLAESLFTTPTKLMLFVLRKVEQDNATKFDGFDDLITKFVASFGAQVELYDYEMAVKMRLSKGVQETVYNEETWLYSLLDQIGEHEISGFDALYQLILGVDYLE